MNHTYLLLILLYSDILSIVQDLLFTALLDFFLDLTF